MEQKMMLINWGEFELYLREQYSFLEQEKVLYTDPYKQWEYSEVLKTLNGVIGQYTNYLHNELPTDQLGLGFVMKLEAMIRKEHSKLKTIKDMHEKIVFKSKINHLTKWFNWYKQFRARYFN